MITGQPPAFSTTCSIHHFPSRWNKLERFCTCQEQLNSYWNKQDGSICSDVNATDNTEISPIAYAVETPRVEHPSLQSKTSSPAVNRGPGRPTDSPWPLLFAALITTIPLLAIYLDNLPAYSGIFWLTEKWMRKATELSTHFPGGLKIPCYVTFHRKKSVVRARHYSRRK